VTTVTTGRTTSGNKLLAAKCHAAVAAVASLDADSCFVYEHFSLSSVEEEA
jgi:hypothetical protein